MAAAPHDASGNRRITPMRIWSIAIAAALLGASAPAASAQPLEEPAEEGADDLPLPERLDRALRDMMEDVQPTLEGALDYLRSFGTVDDPRHYEMPEILPNGDIIIRRREDAPPFRPEPPDAVPGEPGPGATPEPEEGIRT
jgi:hypothetical protein